MKYKAIIFDMDGTIISSEILWKEASHHILKTKTNLSVKKCHEILTQLKGASLYTACTYIKETFNTKESVDELMQIKEQFVFEKFADHVSFIDGFKTFHKALSDYNMKSAIATNANLSSLKQILKHIPLQNFFKEHIYCIDHVNKKAKPQPDIFLHAAKQLGILPNHCIVIEDSAHGIAAAKSAGMFCIAINTGKDKDKLNNADLIIEHYNEINLKKLL